MSDLFPFQNFLNDGGRSPRRGDSRPRQFLADLVEPAFISARAPVGQQPARPTRQWSPGHDRPTDQLGGPQPRARQSGHHGINGTRTSSYVPAIQLSGVTL